MTRKINLKRFFPEMQYEMVDFHVEDCDSKEQATKEVEDWVKEFLVSKKTKEDAGESDAPFGDNPDFNEGTQNKKQSFKR